MGTQPPNGYSPQFSAHLCCGQTAGWIKLPLGMEVGRSPGHVVLDGNPAPPRNGPSSPLPTFDPCLLWPNGWMNQDATSYGDKPWPRPRCVRWERPPPRKKVHNPSIYGPCLLWPNGWTDQGATWYRGRIMPKPHCVRWGPNSPKKRHSPHLAAHICCGQTAGWIIMPLCT